MLDAHLYNLCVFYAYLGILLGTYICTRTQLTWACLTSSTYWSGHCHTFGNDFHVTHVKPSYMLKKICSKTSVYLAFGSDAIHIHVQTNMYMRNVKPSAGLSLVAVLSVIPCFHCVSENCWQCEDPYVLFACDSGSLAVQLHQYYGWRFPWQTNEPATASTPASKAWPQRPVLCWKVSFQCRSS